MGGIARVSVARTSALTRVIWGAALLGAPRSVLRRLGGRQTALAQAVLRVLGARQLVQATVIALHPSPAVLAAGAGVDGLHAMTALAMAVVDRSQRRIAMTWIGRDVYAALHARADRQPTVPVRRAQGGAAG